MIHVNIIINSSIEEVLAFKCCTLPDQNLEIHISNTSDKPVVIQNYFLLTNGEETLRIDNVYPPRFQTINPNDIAAIYCAMDEEILCRYRTLEVYDSDGNNYSAPIEIFGSSPI